MNKTLIWVIIIIVVIGGAWLIFRGGPSADDTANQGAAVSNILEVTDIPASTDTTDAESPVAPVDGDTVTADDSAPVAPETSSTVDANVAPETPATPAQ